MERLAKEKEERLAKKQAKKAESETIKQAKKTAREAEKARKKALKDIEKAKKALKDIDKTNKKGKVTKKVKKVTKAKIKKTKKTKDPNIMDQIGAALNYVSSSSSSESDSEDVELLRKDFNNTWSSKSSEVNTSDFLPSASDDDLGEPTKPSTSTSTSTRRRISEAWVVNDIEEQEMAVDLIPLENDIEKDDVNVVEINIDGARVMVKENVTYVVVEYEGQNWPGMI